MRNDPSSFLEDSISSSAVNRTKQPKPTVPKGAVALYVMQTTSDHTGAYLATHLEHVSA